MTRAPVRQKPTRRKAGSGQRLVEAADGELEDIDRILARLDVEIPRARKEMDELLARLRTTRIAA
jgi:hypothetical protein